MKAAVHYRNGPPEVLTVEEVPDPVAGSGMVALRVEAVSIGGDDTLNRLQGEPVTTPHIVGYQAAGTIVEVGASVPIAYGTAHDCLFKFGHLQAGETVLIQAGAGGVGVGAITIGVPGQDFTPFDPWVLMSQNQSLTGVYLGSEIIMTRVQEMVQGLVDDVATGRLTVLVDRTFDLTEAAAAHAYVESRRAVGRVLLVPGKDQRS